MSDWKGTGIENILRRDGPRGRAYRLCASNKGKQHIFNLGNNFFPPDMVEEERLKLASQTLTNIKIELKRGASVEETKAKFLEASAVLSRRIFGDNPSFRELADRWIETRTVKPQNWNIKLKILDGLSNYFEGLGLKAKKIETHHIADLCRKLAEGGNGDILGLRQENHTDKTKNQGYSPSRIRKVSGAMRQVFNYGIKQGILEDNPAITEDKQFSDVIWPKEEIRENWLSPDEIRILIEACQYIEIDGKLEPFVEGKHNPRFDCRFMGNVIEAFFLTGMRKSELLELTISEVNGPDKAAGFDNGFIRLPKERVKTKLARDIPFSPRLKELFDKIQKEREEILKSSYDVEATERIFHYYNPLQQKYLPLGDLRKKLARVVHNAEILGLNTNRERSSSISLHTFRHSFCRHLVCDLNVPLPVVQKLGGWTSIEQIERRYGVSGDIHLANWVKEIKL